MPFLSVAGSINEGDALMDNERRKFLKIAGCSLLAGIGAPALAKIATTPSYAAEKPGTKEAVKVDKQYGMVIDMRKMMAEPELMEKAIAACDYTFNIPQFPPDQENHAIKWIWEEPFHNAFPEHSDHRLSQKAEESKFLLLCNHCEYPPCVRVCPTQATFKMKSTGIVTQDYHRCIGCRFCMAACPYESRSFNWEDPRPYIKHINPEYPTRTRGVVEKCTFCDNLLAKGEEPACVTAVKESGAIVFGDIKDKNSEISKVLAKEFTIQRKPSVGTNPSVFYIV
jgi:molybdopterin-containing oxidoreductase family iron-sulfur binding subunit